MTIDARNFSITLVTAPDMELARKIATTLVQARLAACASLVPKVESFYWWEGKLENAEEVLLILKSTTVLAGELKAAIRSIHPYTTPEIVTVAMDDGCENYLRWISESVEPRPATEPAE